jgi:hypothetical protein
MNPTHPHCRPLYRVPPMAFLARSTKRWEKGESVSTCGGRLFDPHVHSIYEGDEDGP